MIKKHEIIIYLITFILMINVISNPSSGFDENFNVKWDLTLDGIGHKEYLISVTNLNNFSVDFPIGIYFQDTNFYFNQINNVYLYEWKPILKNVVVYKEEFINKICLNNDDNVTYYNCDYINYVEDGIVEKNILSWKPSKQKFIDEKLNGQSSFKSQSGYINIPKSNSKEKFDDNNNSYDKNGVKKFKLVFDIPINNMKNIGKVGIYNYITNKTYHPWFNSSWVNRQPILFNYTINQANATLNLTINTVSDSMLDNCNDVRIVTNETGVNIELHRINLTNCNIPKTEFWFDFNTTGLVTNAGLNSTYYLYYNNSGAGAPPDNRSFVGFFLDMFDSSIDWVNDWESTSQGSYIVSGGELTASVPGSVTQGIFTENNYNDYTLQYKLKYNKPVGRQMVLDGFENSKSTNTGTEIIGVDTNSPQYDFIEISNIAKNGLNPPLVGVWNRIRAEYPNTGNVTFTKTNYSNNAYINSHTGVPIVSRTNYPFILPWVDGTIDVDWYFIYQYLAVEPVLSLGEISIDEDSTPPDIVFISQTPSDYDINNLDNFDNISIEYEITDNEGVNNSLVNITTFYSPDNGATLSPEIHIVNKIAGEHIHNYTDISGDNYTFFLKDPHIIRGTMRTDPDIWNNGINDFNNTIYKNNDIRVKVSNVTVLTESTYIIEYPLDVSNSNKDLNLYLGNSTGCDETGVSVLNSNNWILLNSINNTQPYSFSNVHTSTFNSDINNEINNLKITNDMCIQTIADNNLISPIIWQGSNIPILNYSWTTLNQGGSLVEINDNTPRFIIHPALLDTSSFCYQINATDINNNTASSVVRCDLYGIGLTPLNPVLRFVNPPNGAAVNGTININGSIVDVDNSGFTSLIRLFYINNTEKIIINNSNNENQTQFTFNTSLVSDSNYYILWSITSGAGGVDNSAHNISIMNNPPDILDIPFINENQSFNGVNISILYLIMLIMGFCLVSVLYSNDMFIVTFFSSIYLILWTVIIYPETFYRVILVSETVFSEGNCLSVIVSGVCDITRFNSTTALNYGREIIVLPRYLKSGLLFLGVLGLSKIAMIRKKRKNELLNIEEFRKMRE